MVMVFVVVVVSVGVSGSNWFVGDFLGMGGEMWASPSPPTSYRLRGSGEPP